MGDVMTKRKVPITGMRGYVDATTVAMLLQESVLDLAEGQSLLLSKPLTLVVLKLDGDLLEIFELSGGMEVARLRTEKSSDFQSYLVSSGDKSLQIVFKKDGYAAFEPGDKVYYISHTSANVAPVPVRRIPEARTGRWNGPSYTK